VSDLVIMESLWWCKTSLWWQINEMSVGNWLPRDYHVRCKTSKFWVVPNKYNLCNSLENHH